MEPTIRAIKEMDAQQLRAAVNEENSRIKGANVVRKQNQNLAGAVGFLGPWIILFILSNDVKFYVKWGESCLILWAGCWWLFHINKPQPLHDLYGDGWDEKARKVLLQASNARDRQYMAEREAEDFAGRM